MRLKQLKISGFKSFVDSVVIPFPSQLLAVVGPNGCGKSNVMDAVRWVMGEVSAKNLRGESMTDVIFNGSTERKPLGQAVVELTFDNSVGRLQGEFARFQDIVVKRTVARDGESRYFLNNTRCRRRDITDLFLGTGSGAKGYSMIGQGTISRLVEARPEELRAYLEEAAGVSKYKDRRRETLTRMEHTKDNLLRVCDIREELDKQLARLDRQAMAARRYHAFKEEEKQCRLDILTLKYTHIAQALLQVRQALREGEILHAQSEARCAHAKHQAEQARADVFSQSQHVEALQAQCYAVGTELARLEAHCQQHVRDKARMSDELKTHRHQLQLQIERLYQQTEQLQQLKCTYEHAREACQQAEQQCKDDEQHHAKEQHDIKTHLARCNDVQLALHTAQNAMALAKVKQTHAKTRQQEAQRDIETCLMQQQQASLVQHHAQEAQLKQHIEAMAHVHEQEKTTLSQAKATKQSAQEQLGRLSQHIETQQANLYALKGQHAEVFARWKAAVNVVPSTEASSWQDKRTLGDALQVDSQWLLACEVVLGESLSAIVLDAMPSMAELAHQRDVWLTVARTPLTTSSPYPKLLDKMNAFYPALPLNLNRVYAAESAEQAKEWLSALNEDDSVITPQGDWYGKDWCKLRKADKDAAGPLQLKENAQQLEQELQEKTAALAVSQAKRQHLVVQLAEHESDIDRALNTLQEIQTALNAQQAELKHVQRTIAQVMLEQSRAEEAYTLALEKLEQAKEEEVLLATDLQQLQATLTAHQAEYEAMQQQHPYWEARLLEIQAEQKNAQHTLHEQQLACQKQELAIAQLEREIDLNQDAQHELNERVEALQERLYALHAPHTKAQADLDETLCTHQQLEGALSKQKDELATLNAHLRHVEEALRAYEADGLKRHQALSEERAKEQGLIGREQSVLDALSEQGLTLNTLNQRETPTLTLEASEAKLIELLNKIKQLGAVNLAAIEEFQHENERKIHLDNQYQDLQSALSMLETAISTIDKETERRLQETFDAVNTAFSQLFPRLFGGGRARLELTCDNLLEAGVLVMAQPPGKRNSTIHLLSGGEKAMTAVALVFAIFQLNPSPFCMLDEVDAPLDDANVGRFCALVKEMSEQVQFLFITHNKVTMELADHLVGVTMREPGVSRVVAVDVEQALSLTEA